MVPPELALRWPPRFVLNQPVLLEEDRTVEFKEITGKNPASTIIDTVEDYVVAFLNGEGGRILWGIHDQDRVVVGVVLDARARDDIRRGVANKVHTIQPALDPSRYRLEFHSVAGEAVLPEMCVIEVSIEHIPAADPFFNHSGEAFVRINGVKQKLNGPKLTAWIKTRLRHDVPSPGSIDDSKLRDLVQRIRRIFSEHGLEPAHLARFLEVRKAPFSIGFRDIQTDAAFLQWLDEAKIDWISHTFLIRREWIDGEDDRVHEEFSFDKQPERFFSTISQHVDALIYDEIHDSPYAYFLRWGVGKEWERKGETRVFVVLAVPLARFSNERTIWKYITDQAPYPWEYGRTNIQLRAWARLLAVYKGVYCFGAEIPYETGVELESNTVFLRDVIENHRVRTRDDWHPEDYALYPSESLVAKDTDTFPQVLEFLKRYNLPWEATGFPRQ